MSEWKDEVEFWYEIFISTLKSVGKHDLAFAINLLNRYCVGYDGSTFHLYACKFIWNKSVLLLMKKGY